MRSTSLSLSGVMLCFVVAATGACASHRGDFGVTSKASPLGVFPASSSMTQKYGIVEWRLFFGKKQTVVTGYASDGSAVRGVQLAWYPAANGMAAHTKLSMLDGSGTSIRRMVGGGITGHFSDEQKLVFDTMRYDLARAKPAAAGVKGSSYAGGLQAQDFGAHTLDTTGAPNGGPDCQAEQMKEAQTTDSFDCASGVAGLIEMPETLGASAAAAGSALGSCASWYYNSEHVQSVCDAENTTGCDSDGNCTFPDPQSDGSATPQQQCDTQCLCANYPDTAQGCGQVGPCSADSDCSNGETCQGSTCQAPAADALTDQNTSTNNSGASSCGSGDVSTDGSNGDVGCSSTSGNGGSSNPTNPGSGDNPDDGNSGTGDYCANDGDSCGADSDCCNGSCTAGVCGGSCMNDGDSCIADSDCCGGSCSGGSCGSGGNNCANDGDSCSQDSDCCNGSCSSGTCGNGMCANDGDSCSQDSDCCNGTCTNGTCGSGGNSCGNPGDSCGSDSDCCSYSCDPDYYVCN